jgi:hypothetical protein
MHLQRNKYSAEGLDMVNPQDQSFYKRYNASTKVAFEKKNL